MPNANYVKGRRKEYKVVKQLKEHGFDIAQRSAGSHSPVDIFAIDKINRRIVLVQCKPSSMAKTRRNKILEENKELNGRFEVKFIVL